MRWKATTNEDGDECRWCGGIVLNLIVACSFLLLNKPERGREIAEFLVPERGVSETGREARRRPFEEEKVFSSASDDKKVYIFLFAGKSERSFHSSTRPAPLSRFGQRRNSFNRQHINHLRIKIAYDFLGFFFSIFFMSFLYFFSFHFFLLLFTYNKHFFLVS